MKIKTDINSIAAKELISLLVSAKPIAEVENDEELYVKPKGAIESDESGLCSLVVRQDLGSSLQLGNFRIDVGGVSITVSRDVDGNPQGDYKFEGAEIVYEGGESADDVVKVIKENVTFPPFDEEQYNNTDFDPDDVEDSVEVGEEDIFAADEDGNVYCYGDEAEVPDGQTVIDADEAVHVLVEKWSENGGEIDDVPIESFGPWS